LFLTAFSGHEPAGRVCKSGICYQLCILNCNKLGNQIQKGIRLSMGRIDKSQKLSLIIRKGEVLYFAGFYCTSSVDITRQSVFLRINEGLKLPPLLSAINNGGNTGPRQRILAATPPVLQTSHYFRQRLLAQRHRHLSPYSRFCTYNRTSSCSICLT
jgi:hypothetical protein